MKNFDSLLKTNSSKRKYLYDYTKIYKKGRFATSVDYDYFENTYIDELLAHNNKKKYDEDFLILWGHLDMRTYIDYDLGNTINLYFTNSFRRIPINQLEDYNYMPENARKMNLLDIKYSKHLMIENIEFKNLYLASFEILDKNNIFRPYVLLFTKNENGEFNEIAYGYDSNDNGNVELFIDSFNYPVFLTPKGYIFLPLKNKEIKFKVHDYIDDEDIKKIMD